MVDPFAKEAARVRAEYERRAREIEPDFYGLDKPANRFIREGQERALSTALAKAALLPLTGRSVLEIGCGSGNWFPMFFAFGAAAVAGIELDEGRASLARARYPMAEVRTGDATRLPYPDARFDVVFQSTVFTSILDALVKRRLAEEMLRVLRPEGAVLWYDFHYDNPRNDQVRGVTPREIERLFPGCALSFERVTLAPPLARLLAPRARVLASLLERLTLLNSHTFATIRKR